MRCASARPGTSNHFRPIMLRVPHFNLSNLKSHQCPDLALMSTENVHPPSAPQRHKTESSLTRDGARDEVPAPLVVNGMDGETSTGAPSTPTLAHDSNSDGPLSDQMNGSVVVVSGSSGLIASVPAPVGPPPPYSEEPRRARRSTVRSVSTDSDEDLDERNDAYEESTPLLNGRPRRRSRTASYVRAQVLSLKLIILIMYKKDTRQWRHTQGATFSPSCLERNHLRQRSMSHARSANAGRGTLHPSTDESTGARSRT
jgi:hypothetical protein